MPVWLSTVLGAVVFEMSPVMTVYVPLPSFLLPRRLRDRHADRMCRTPSTCCARPSSW